MRSPTVAAPAALVLALILSACGQDPSEPGTSAVDPNAADTSDPVAAYISDDVGRDMPDGSTVTVEVHRVEVIGKLLLVEVLLTPQSPGDSETEWEIDEMVPGLPSYGPEATLTDALNTTEYRVVRARESDWSSAISLSGAGCNTQCETKARAASGETTRWWAYFAAPPPGVESLQLQLDDGNQPLLDVPVRVRDAAATTAADWTELEYLAWADSITVPQELPPVTQEMLESSTVVWEVNREGNSPYVIVYDAEAATIPMDATETEGQQTTISLATDILFAPDAWDISANAADRIGELLTDVPQGATVDVTGHTDSVVGAVSNQELSENRAQAVADVIAEARPDLDLQVAGYADTRPAVPEDPEDPSTRAANRRVEVSYAG
ncbi:MAG: OmpA family protein [Beutenbergiaceae bacterium]